MLLNILLLVACGMVGIAYTFFRNFFRFRRPLGIHDLPLELLSEIASHLDFVDVISLGQSTRKLRKATEARVVWHSLAKSYSTRHFNIPRPESGTIDTLKTNELREWISPRLAIDQIWAKKTVIPVARTFDLQKGTMNLCLVPGGRWFLTTRETGHVDFYDINSKEPVPQMLLEPSMPGEEEIELTRLVIDVNREEAVLDFTFAFNSTRSTPQKSRCFGWLNIGRARLVGTGSSATLKAHKIISIPYLRKEAQACAIGLCGDRVARAVIPGFKHCIEIFKWKECTPNELMFTNIHVNDRLSSVRRNMLDTSSFTYLKLEGHIFFVGEDRVLCVARIVSIYRVPPLSRLAIDWDPEVGYHSDQDITHPLWTYPERSLGSHSTPSFSFDGTDGYHLVVQHMTRVVGIYIPLSADQQPSVRFQIQHTSLPSIGVGLYKGITGHRSAPVIRFRCDWDGEGGPNFLTTQGTDWFPFSEALFDEETGRCLFSQLRLKTIKIVEFI